MRAGEIVVRRLILRSVLAVCREADGDVQVREASAPARLEWSRSDANGVFELTASGWGTRVRAEASVKGLPWDRVNARQRVEVELRELLDQLGSGSLKK